MPELVREGLCTRSARDLPRDGKTDARRHNEKEHGEYRTKLTILNLYDQMAKDGVAKT